MCGISVLISSTPLSSSLLSLSLTSILPRGPSHNSTTQIPHPSNHIVLQSTILSIRNPLTPQPVNGLLFNGEIYSCNNSPIIGNDTNFLSDHINRLNPIQSLKEILPKLVGEYALTLLTSSSLLFLKDPIGRRSLLYNKSDGALRVSSVAYGEGEWIEVKPGVIYEYFFDTGSIREYNMLSDPVGDKCIYEDHYGTFKKKLNSSVSLLLPPPNTSAISIFFSGGIDCTILTYLLAKQYKGIIELWNIKFQDITPDREASLRGYLELKSILVHDDVDLRFLEIDCDEIDIKKVEGSVWGIIKPKKTIMDFNLGTCFYILANCKGYRMR